MTDQDSDTSSGPTWHALLGPLPPNAVPLRQPVASPEVLAGPTGWAVAGWEQLVMHLSAGAAGSRTILVVLDANGSLLSASDSVLYTTGPTGAPPPNEDMPARIHVATIGGRFEPDGSFHGTRWLSVAIEPGKNEEPEWELARSDPSADDVAGLRIVVAELIRRQPPRA